MDIIYTITFMRQLKKLPKYLYEIKDELTEFLECYTPEQQESIGHDCYKIRFISKYLKKGKSGSLRIIIFLMHKGNSLLPLSIYLKSQKENISKKEVFFLMKEVIKEIKNR